MKLENLMQTLKQGEAGLVTSEQNRLYLTGQKTSAGTVLVTPDACYLVIDFRYYEKVRRAVAERGFEVLLQKNTGEQLTALLDRHNIQKVFLETSLLPYDELTRWESLLGSRVCRETSFDRTLTTLRCRKSKEELEQIINAQQLTDEAFAHITKLLRPGMTENDAALELEFFGRKRGAQGVAFDFIVVSGEKSALPHGSPDEKVMQDGDFVTMDFGFTINGYRSDMTRTVALGHASDKMRLVYHTVLEAQLAALAAYRPGITGKEADKVARDVIEQAGFGDCFGHGLGHGVGIDIHEAPTAGPSGNAVLEEGMTLTCEPGIYIAGEFGVRIEDMGYFTKDGFVNITHSPKELLIL